MIKQVISAAMVLLAAAGGYAAYDQLNANRGQQANRAERQAPSAIAVETAPAVQERIASEVEAVGTSLARQSVEVVALASGRVKELLFEPGQRVSTGDVLIRLDDDIERADLAQAEASLREAQLALQRSQTLRQRNAVAQATLDQAETQNAIAEANLDRARRRLADRTVLAPFGGVVGMRRVDVGARVDDSTVLTTLDDLTEVRVEFSVSETLYGQVAEGQTVFATTAAYPDRRFQGKIDSIDSRIDPTGRAFKIRATIPNEDLALPAGMFMHVTLELESRQAVIVPETAIVPQGGKSYVYVVKGEKAERRAVVLGARQPGSVEIADGLAPGEIVVVSGSQRLRDGAQVRAVKSGGTAG